MQYRIIVCGRVQGVFYRAFAKAEAEKLGITGWSKNLEDGSVEIMAEGEKEAVSEFLAKLRVGPEKSSVERLEISKWHKEEREYTSFEILR